jgi:hypothetical protein
MFKLNIGGNKMVKDFTKGFVSGCSITSILCVLNKNNMCKKSLQPNRVYSGKEFIKLNNTSYYKISPRSLCELSEKDFLSQGRVEFKEKNDFIKNYLPNIDNNKQYVEKLIITEKTPELFVESYLSVSLSGKNVKCKIIDPEIEFN